VTPSHLYVHAPFCVRRCAYCDFAVTVERAPDPVPWLESVEAELATTVARERWSRLRLTTVYIGGGTPSVFGHGVMADLARRIERFADIEDDAEWTVEANPETFDERLAVDWRAAGINRVSLGAQTFHADTLRWMGRLHGPDGPGRAVAAARAAGFENVSIDLIFGLPPRLGRDWAGDLARVLDMAPQHISLYGLTAESGTPLGRWVAEGREQLADEAAYEAEYLEAAETLARAGYEHYEVSNFARQGRTSRHNAAYWSGVPWLGLGPGAHSYLPPRRYWNVRDWARYRDAIVRGGNTVEDEEVVDDGAAELERSWLGLRTSAGVIARTDRETGLARRWQEQGWAVMDGDRVRLTPRGWLVLDRLAVEFAGRPAAGVVVDREVAMQPTQVS
jgi:oxygen-independent coproporphyrinogen-3 oxidase